MRKPVTCHPLLPLLGVHRNAGYIYLGLGMVAPSQLTKVVSCFGYNSRASILMLRAPVRPWIDSLCKLSKSMAELSPSSALHIIKSLSGIQINDREVSNLLGYILRRDWESGLGCSNNETVTSTGADGSSGMQQP